MDTVAILIPCYNEANTIAKVVADCKNTLQKYPCTVYVYDNNSTDGTADIAAKAGAVVLHEYKQGKGNVIRRMFREIDAACYIMLDGDDTYPAKHIEEMATLVLEKQADMVVGDRLSSSYFTENTRRFHNSGNVLVRQFINTFFHSDIKDIMTGYRAFSYEFVKTFPVLSAGFEIETEMSIHAIDKNMQIETVVVEYRDRPAGSVSKLNTFRDGFKVLCTILSMYRSYKPLSFFSIIAAVLIALAALFFVPHVLLPYLSSGLVLNFPTLFVCCFAALAGLLSLSCGLTLDSILKNNKREFEYRLLIASDTKKKLLSQRNISP